MFEGLGKKLLNNIDLIKWLMENERKYNQSQKTNLDKAQRDRDNAAAREWFANLGGK